MTDNDKLEMTHLRRALKALALSGAGALIATASAHADRIDNGVAVFSALDKVTARTSKFEVPLNSTAQFGQLKVTPRVCYSRPPEEQPKTTSFVEVDEIQLDGQEKAPSHRLDVCQDIRPLREPHGGDLHVEHRGFPRHEAGCQQADNYKDQEQAKSPGE